MQTNQTREDWLQTATNEVRPLFAQVGFPLPDKIRVTCGFPSRKVRALNKAIGEHWSPSASNDNTHEILISPVEDDPFQVLGILMHELAHASTDGDGHGRKFGKCARALWLEGKLTSTVIGDAFKLNFAPILESLGAYPHAKLNVGHNVKVQSTRMLKAHCPSCGYTVRLSQKWANVGAPICPADRMTLLIDSSTI
jgi:ribosomal protein L37E